MGWDGVEAVPRVIVFGRHLRALAFYINPIKCPRRAGLQLVRSNIKLAFQF